MLRRHLIFIMWEKNKGLFQKKVEFDVLFSRNKPLFLENKVSQTDTIDLNFYYLKSRSFTYTIPYGY